MEKRLLESSCIPQGQWSRGEQGYSDRAQKGVKGLALLLTILLLALAGCIPQPDLVGQQLIDAVNNQNLNGAARLFASDAVVGIGSSASYSGRGEIEHLLEGLFADNLKLNMLHSEVRDGKVTSDFTITLDSASHLGVTSLAGTSVMTVQAGSITELQFTLNDETQAKLLKAKLNVGSPRLTYAVLPDPSPLRVSEGSEVNKASLTILITNHTDQPVNVTSITFSLPNGYQAGDITGILNSIRPINSRNEIWSINAEGGLIFRLAPRIVGEGQLGPGDGLSATLLYIPVNEEPGLWDLEIEEVIATETGEATKSSTTIQLAKLPSSFYVSDLSAEPLIIPSGGETTLWWSGNRNATYTIRYWDGTQEINQTVEGPDYKYEVKNLLETTTFYLIAEARVIDKTVTVQRERTVTVR